MKIECICRQCGKTSYVYPSHVKRGGGKFCSISCSTTYRNLRDNPAKRDDVKKKIGETSEARQAIMKRGKYGRYGCDEKHPKGPQNPAYKNGIGSYRNIIDVRGAQCEECKSEFKKNELDVHHIDGDRSNNISENLEVLCKYCHHVVRHEVNKRIIKYNNEKKKGVGANA